MFPADKHGEWEPTKIRPQPAPVITNGASNDTNSLPDVEMQDASGADSSVVKTDAPAVQPPDESLPTDPTYEEDLESAEGAVYPLRSGRIENWSCFLALLTHIYNTLSPPFHTPVLVIAQPCWSARDHELLTQFFFENFKIPAFCLMDAALASCYAYGVPTATVIDVGHGKCDVTAVSEFVVCDAGRGIAVAGCGGEDMTQRLLQLLEPKGFNESMCDQLKRSPVCEILPVGTNVPGEKKMEVEEPIPVTNPAAAASTGAVESGVDAKEADGSKPGQAPRGPGLGTEVGEEGGTGEEEENEGVLDVASIVAKGNAQEFLAKREKEKAEKAAARKAASLEAARPTRLRNSERPKATFTCEEYVPSEEAASTGESIAPSRKRKREVEVGGERFMAASPATGLNDGVLDIIAATIHSTILAVPDVANRSALWDNLIILGNGSRVRGRHWQRDCINQSELTSATGFTPSLLSTLSTRYTLSPSNATIFTSELPSNFSTPMPTGGTNTPIPGNPTHAMHHPAAHGVNPLLVAATKHANQQMQASSQTLQVPGAPDPNFHQSQRGHNQTPTSIKTVKAPEYFPEWKEIGMEDAGFLGAQVAAKVIFVVDGGVSKGFLTRGEYNDMGPVGIHDCAM